MSALAQPRSREFAFVEADHVAIARLAYEEAGIVLPAGKSQLVYGRLAPRVRAHGLSAFSDYLLLLDEDPTERTCAIEALTTNHTSFFREDHHFDHFAAHAWPALAARLAAGGRVRLWSSACSSGEEPYSLAMALLGKDRRVAGTLARQDLRILATDLSSDILATARAGYYSSDTMKTVPAPLRAAWFDRDGTGARVSAELRAPIDFRQLNLLREWPMRRPFDAIFCRNVMIYFDEPTKARLLNRLADQLVPGGFLYLGHSERLSANVAPRFTMLGRTLFQKVAS